MSIEGQARAQNVADARLGQAAQAANQVKDVGQVQMLKNQIDELCDGFGSIDRRLSLVKAQLLGISAPTEEVSPCAVPEGDLAVLRDSIERLGGLSVVISEHITALEQL